METTKIEKITEDEFYKKFYRQENHFDSNASFDGCMFETFGEELDYVLKMSKMNRVITIIEGDEDFEKSITTESGAVITEPNSNMYYTTGFHFVNRMGYFVIDKPYKYEFEVKVE